METNNRQILRMMAPRLPETNPVSPLALRRQLGTLGSTSMGSLFCYLVNPLLSNS